jgi:hypothetical protein
MAYLVIENFKRGLDTRRNILTSEPGCLVEMDNAHVTRGGEIEKRKAFKLVGNVGIETYGLEGCGDTVFVFGSAPTAQVPVGVTYQRLIHPDGPSFSMTKVVSFTSYAGKPFVIAEFNDGARYCYYNGEIVQDSYNGIYRLSHGDIQGFLEHIESLLPSGYSAVLNSSGLTLAGPQGKTFTVTTTVSGKFTASTPVTSQTAVKPIPEVLSKGSFVISGGSSNPAALWKDGRNMDAASCPGIRSIRVGASSVTSTDGMDLIGWSGTTGLKYNTYTPTYTPGSNWGNLLYCIAKAINDNTTAGLAHKYSALSYLRAYNSGNDTNSMYVYAPNDVGADANGTLVQIEFDGDPSGVYDIQQLIDPATIAPSPYGGHGGPGGGRHIATMGTLAGGTTNAITEVKVDGVDILGGHVHWVQSNSNTAQTAADKINSYQSTVEYSASVIDGGKIVLTASANSGASFNGRVISVTTLGNIAISSVVPMGGGVDPVGGISQRTTVGLATSGTHAETVGSTFRMTIIESDNTTYPKYVGSTAMAGLKLNYCFTYKSKVNLLADSYLISSALDDPKDWKPSGIGVFFIDMSNNTNGTEDLVAAAPYQGKLAVFSRSSCQIWGIDVDPQNNALSQVVLNTGTVAPGSVISYGELDVFYLSDSGIRSLKARDSSSNAQVTDVGVNIDTIVSQKLSEIPESTIFNTACSVIEPRDNRLIMNVYDKMFVLSSYPTAGIQAWSTYTPEILPVKLMTIKGKMYARYGNSIYLYGGTSGNEYDACTTSMTLPYLDAGKPAHQKHLEGIDLTSDGSWDFYVGTDPYRPEVRDHVGIIDNSTFQLGRVMALGIGTHIGVKLTSRGSTYGRVGNLLLHFQTNEAD